MLDDLAIRSGATNFLGVVSSRLVVLSLPFDVWISAMVSIVLYSWSIYLFDRKSSGLGLRVWDFIYGVVDSQNVPSFREPMEGLVSIIPKLPKNTPV